MMYQTSVSLIQTCANKITPCDFKDTKSINDAAQITKNSSVRTNVDTYAGVYETA